MKKRFLLVTALALALGLAACEDPLVAQSIREASESAARSNTPSSTPTPSSSEPAGDSSLPDQTSEPDASSIPDESSQPDASSIPDESSQPDASSIPDESSQPDASSIPDESSQPDASSIPDESSQPDSSVPSSDSSQLDPVKPVVSYSKNGLASVDMALNSSSATEEYMILDLAMAVNDTIIFSYGELSLGYTELKNTSVNPNSVTAGENNKIVAKVAGNYSFYVGVEDLTAINLYDCIHMVAPKGEEPPVSNKVVYLNPNADWKSNNATFACYMWVGDDQNWLAGTAAGDYYSFEIPGKYQSIIFVRLKPSTAEGYVADNNGLNWSNKWNQSPNLTVPTDDNIVYTITDWAAGSWGPLAV